eukprot:14614.XXX_1118257_1118722_1 [CDS] Oithona nana genome sequencing.
MADQSKPSHVQRFLTNKRSKTLSESSESSIGAESLNGDMIDDGPRKRLGSVPNRDELESRKDAGAMNNYLYDKYLANFFNPLHSKPHGEGMAPVDAKSGKGVLYDLDGKFAYSTYSEEMRSYHPMLDIRKLTQDLK